MKVKIFDPSNDRHLSSGQNEGQKKLERAINNFLLTGITVKQITQSSNGSEVCISIWYEEKSDSQSVKFTARQPEYLVLAEAFRKLDVSIFNLSLRTNVCCNTAGIKNAGQLIEKMFSLKICKDFGPNFGLKSYCEIRDKLAEVGIDLPERINYE